MKTILVSKASDIPRDPIHGKVTFVYWNIMGLAQAIRLTLACAKVDWVDVRIDAGNPTMPDYKKAWTDAKPSLSIPFPNLPYYMDERVKLTQSNTILRYLGRTHGLMGMREHETDLFIDQLSDIDGAITRCCYGRGADAVLDLFKEKASAWLDAFQPFLEKASGFLSGSEPTVADCKFYVLLQKMSMIQDQLGNAETAEILGKEWIVQYLKRFEAIPSIKDYMDSTNFMKSGMNNPHAKWSG